ncbi:MAG: hypothetical protein LBE04_08685 [Prevotellaceae bacterium]|jgi:hypothetical protein|nr:hypothetical protein [Prevotellaceae bacterium]
MGRIVIACPLMYIIPVGYSNVPVVDRKVEVGGNNIPVYDRNVVDSSRNEVLFDVENIT